MIVQYYFVLFFFDIIIAEACGFYFYFSSYSHFNLLLLDHPPISLSLHTNVYWIHAQSAHTHTHTVRTLGYILLEFYGVHFQRKTKTYGIFYASGKVTNFIFLPNEIGPQKRKRSSGQSETFINLVKSMWPLITQHIPNDLDFCSQRKEKRSHWIWIHRKFIVIHLYHCSFEIRRKQFLK